MLKMTINLDKCLILDQVQFLANKLEKYNSEIIIRFQNQEANCKSLINTLAIGILNMKKLNFIINGPDEKEVSEFLNYFLNNLEYN